MVRRTKANISRMKNLGVHHKGSYDLDSRARKSKDRFQKIDKAIASAQMARKRLDKTFSELTAATTLFDEANLALSSTHVSTSTATAASATDSQLGDIARAVDSQSAPEIYDSASSRKSQRVRTKRQDAAPMQSTAAGTLICTRCGCTEIARL